MMIVSLEFIIFLEIAARGCYYDVSATVYYDAECVIIISYVYISALKLQ